MGIQVTTGAMMTCSFGVAPSALSVVPAKMVMAGGKPAATILDNVPVVNIPPFGMCTSLSNPTVASATAAALGVLTPMPCVPVTTAPWAPGSPTVLVGNTPTLNESSKCVCAWGGMISFSFPGQVTVMVP
ncbi:MAG TPA: DUF4280 domain-containing protein [Acidimicrobiales bacterium]|nr:DUF4280 domain-containing protein [Acidimicrobiales bacterium]